MKFALVNPNWTFEGSTYFGCRDPHYPLELLFASDQISAAGHEPLLIDAQVDDLSIDQVREEVQAFRPDFLVIPTAPSYLFWRCPQPELRVPMQWFAALGDGTIRGCNRSPWLSDSGSNAAQAELRRGAARRARSNYSRAGEQTMGRHRRLLLSPCLTERCASARGWASPT